MANNWLTQELPGLNPDWFSHIKLFSIKHACRFFFMNWCDICFFPLGWENVFCQARFEDNRV